jgi:hypothetical protein
MQARSKWRAPTTLRWRRTTFSSDSTPAGLAVSRWTMCPETSTFLSFVKELVQHRAPPTLGNAVGCRATRKFKICRLWGSCSLIGVLPRRERTTFWASCCGRWGHPTRLFSSAVRRKSKNLLLGPSRSSFSPSKNSGPGVPFHPSSRLSSFWFAPQILPPPRRHFVPVGRRVLWPRETPLSPRVALLLLHFAPSFLLPCPFISPSITFP